MSGGFIEKHSVLTAFGDVGWCHSLLRGQPDKQASPASQKRNEGPCLLGPGLVQRDCSRWHRTLHFMRRFGITPLRSINRMRSDPRLLYSQHPSIKELGPVYVAFPSGQPSNLSLDLALLSFRKSGSRVERPLQGRLLCPT